ncbi:hypothetical protein [Paractinoplanes toevensis]|uniref:Uncharacterized protein n=1 Tax=Paractinoplanes toevensis TaxID=571911 RepID=A0A919W4W9_9ACTN|nr:hypothetical protein [Actinoplanes toevensis]GIM94654.1 hypothetical protein Ato02nite_064470 [Actinoplanes toevensis]
MSVEAARAVADAVLYEGYLLYPYRASAAKNRSRWQFGVLGPPAAASSAFAEGPAMVMSCLLSPAVRSPSVTLHLRFLQLQAREVRDAADQPVGSLEFAGETVLSWDEAVEQSLTFERVPLDGAVSFPVIVPGSTSVQEIGNVGSVVRRRWPLTARLSACVVRDGELLRLTVTVANEHPAPVTDKETAVRHSLLGAHLLAEAHHAVFLSMQDPPPAARAAAARCHQERCWPVLAGADTVLLGAPIILYDHPSVAEQSPGELFDATEIDEILTLRVLTMTDAEKAEARATDPRAATIVDRCETLSPADLQRLHGGRVSPAVLPAESPWWDPSADASVSPESDAVLVGDVPVRKGSLVRLHPRRRADAQDMFVAGLLARVTAVLSDVDGGTHVAVVLVDDPAADLHDWYGRYLYFAPDELSLASGEETPC